MSLYVIDTSVVLAAIFGEPGGDLALQLIPDSFMSSINLAEIITKLVSNGYTQAQFEPRLANLNLKTVPFTDDLALITGLLRNATHHKGLSLGDRACLALGLREKLPVYTADRAWTGLNMGIDIRLLR